ncbi:MAG: SUMF1/EgtB/PvdO family nonheme iron enzyme [Polyangiaceae bacterium]
MDERAKHLATLRDPSASLAARIEAGHRLADLGDPRATAVDRVLIPAGPCTLGGPGPDSDTPAWPTRHVHVSAFRIDRYPVTVAAYSAFITAGGYRSRRYWTDRGWSFRTESNLTRPRFWGDPEWSAYLIPNHPVVGVSCHEAEAYAAFMDARLPTEAEWEKACRGEHARLYPWGDTFLEDACAMRTYGPRGTVPIGTFPRGETPLGLSDMVGSVWQWCRDVSDDAATPGDTDPLVDPDEYDESAPRVTRGGAWNTLKWSVCSISRNAYPPTAQFSNLGFRLVEDVEDP